MSLCRSLLFSVIFEFSHVREVVGWSKSVFPRLGVFCAANWGLIASMPACFVIYYKHARYGKHGSRVLVDFGRRRCSKRVTPTYECITDKEYETTKAIFYVRCGEIATTGWRGIKRSDVYRPHWRHAVRSVAFVHPKRSLSFF